MYQTNNKFANSYFFCSTVHSFEIWRKNTISARNNKNATDDDTNDVTAAPNPPLSYEYEEAG